MRMVGCVIRAAHRVFPLSDHPEWHGLAWVSDEYLGICVVDYLHRRLGRTEQLMFSHVVPEDGSEWLIAEEEAEGVEGWVSVLDPQLSADFYEALTPEEIDGQERLEVRLNMLAIRAAIRLETLPPEELQRMAERLVGLEDEPEVTRAAPEDEKPAELKAAKPPAVEPPSAPVLRSAPNLDADGRNWLQVNRGVLARARSVDETPLERLSTSLLMAKVAVECGPEALAGVNGTADTPVPTCSELLDELLQASTVWENAEGVLEGRMPNHTTFAFNTRVLLREAWTSTYDAFLNPSLRVSEKHAQWAELRERLERTLAELDCVRTGPIPSAAALSALARLAGSAPLKGVAWNWGELTRWLQAVGHKSRDALGSCDAWPARIDGQTLRCPEASEADARAWLGTLARVFVDGQTPPGVVGAAIAVFAWMVGLSPCEGQPPLTTTYEPTTDEVTVVGAGGTKYALEVDAVVAWTVRSLRAVAGDANRVEVLKPVEGGAREATAGPLPQVEPPKALPPLKPWAMEAWRLRQFGMTVIKIADALAAKYKDERITQPRVTEQIQLAKAHAEASGLAAIAAKALPLKSGAAPARTFDPAAADQGRRTDGKAHHLRERERQKAEDGDDEGEF